MIDTRRTNQYSDSDADDMAAAIPLRAVPQRSRNVLEAQVQEGDTLQAIAIRYRCSVADIKRLNKIERDFEIHAHKTLQVPLTADNILADHLTATSDDASLQPSATDQLLATLETQAANLHLPPAVGNTITSEPTINDIILNTRIERNQYADPCIDDPGLDDDKEHEQHLLINDDHVPQPRPIQGRSILHDISCSGSGADMSWICLFIVILALCLAIPLIYVLYIAEHHVDTDESLDGHHQHHDAAAAAAPHHAT